jgi:alkylated DNA repair protein (DNA oxidative demethylase)
MSGPIELTPGVFYWPRYLDPAQQRSLSAEVFRLAESASLYRPEMPRTGHKLSVEMTNFGSLGWFTDAQQGYRYEPFHPLCGTPWPQIPGSLLNIWRTTTGYSALPEACLVNLYRGKARMGLHRDSDELARDAPVLSVSLGDKAVFRFGPARKISSTQTILLESGDVLVFGGAARFMLHGIDRILPGTSSLIPGGGRVNLTLRRVTIPDEAQKKAADQGGDRPPNALFALDAGRG